jgi:hypothetical protein
MSTDAALCEWLHRSLDALPVFSHPFDVAKLPNNGIYFFYEKGEYCGHGTGSPRVLLTTRLIPLSQVARYVV